MQTHVRFNALGRLSRWVMLPVFMAAALGSAPLSTAHAIGSIITVNTLDGGLQDDAGSGACSLAEAIENANNDGGGTLRLDCVLGTGDDDIVFGGAAASGTITLTQTLPTIDDPQNETTVIDGDGDITIDGDNTYEIFTVSGYAGFRDLIIQNAYDVCCSAGAVYNAVGGNLTVERTLFFGNNAAGNGGAILNDGTLTVDRSTFTSNGAGAGGAAIYNSGTATVSNSTFYNNAASTTGGGAIASNGTTTVYSSTFSQNSSPASTGAAVHVVAGTTELYNNILANSSSGFDCDIDSGSVPGSYNLIEDDNCGFTDGAGGMILGDDPRLGSLVNVPAYFTLLNDSPALDAGNNSFAVGSVDEPGNPRMSNIPWAADTGAGIAPIIDMGAYEHQINCPGGSQLYVDGSAGGESSGSSWTDAFPDLQMALFTVNSCGSPVEVWVAGGVYKPDGGVPGSTYETFTIPPGARVYGGFSGTETSLGERDPGANVTILSGDIDENDTNAGGSEIDETTADISGLNSHRVVYMNGVGTPITGSTVLDGFTITGGDGVAGSSFGGGMLCFGQGGTCSPTLSSITFSGNTGTYGGALLNQGDSSGTSSPTLTDVTFSGNSASGGGGAVYNWGGGSGSVSSPSFTNVTFYNNSAATAGAMWNDGNSGGDSSPTLTNVTFNNNSTTSGSGGAIYNGSLAGTSNPELTNVILWGNSAVGTGQQIQNETGAGPTINYSVVQGGDAGSNMGSAYSSGFGNTLNDPVLGPLKDNGGSTRTMALLAGSSAIDAGDGGSCSANDQRWVSRPRGAACDIGAYERIPPFTDFDYDDITDPAKFVPSTGVAWWFESDTSMWDGMYLGSDVAEYVGRSDFDGDAISDPAKYVSSNQTLWYFQSSDSTWQGTYLGTGTYSMLPGSDFDGDQKTDPAKYDSLGTVWRLLSGTSTWAGTFVGTDAAPALPGSDYDGDGKTDVAKYIAAGAIWYFGSSDSTWHGMYIGSDGAPVPASDFDGDGITDMAKYLSSSNSLWYVSSTDGTWIGVYLGPGTFTYVPAADFDGDGKTDPAKFDTSSQVLWWLKSSTGLWDGIYMGPETYSIVN